MTADTNFIQATLRKCLLLVKRFHLRFILQRGMLMLLTYTNQDLTTCRDVFHLVVTEHSDLHYEDVKDINRAL